MDLKKGNLYIEGYGLKFMYGLNEMYGLKCMDLKQGNVYIVKGMD